MNLSPWFEQGFRPVRVGVYEVKDINGYWVGTTRYAYWNGRRFGWRSQEIKQAFENKGESTILPAFVTWRGVVK